MAKLQWDQTGERFYELGVDHGVLYPVKADGTYDNGVAWNGLTAVTESPEGGEPNDMYADNIKYASLRSAETFGGTIEAFQSPPEFDQCDGMASPADGVSLGQQSRVPFGFCYRTKVGNDAQGQDAGYKLHLVYNCTASPSEKNYETVNDSPEGITLSWEFESTGVAVAGYKPISTIVINSLEADSTKLEVLENTLYGTVSEEATLPTPSEVLAIFVGNTSNAGNDGN